METERDSTPSVIPRRSKRTPRSSYTFVGMSYICMYQLRLRYYQRQPAFNSKITTRPNSWKHKASIPIEVHHFLPSEMRDFLWEQCQGATSSGDCLQQVRVLNDLLSSLSIFSSSPNAVLFRHWPDDLIYGDPRPFEDSNLLKAITRRSSPLTSRNLFLRSCWSIRCAVSFFVHSS